MERKVLFVCSGNKKNGISPIVFNQGESIKKFIDVEYFPIKGVGLKGYILHYFPLRKKIKNGNYTTIHAHYSLCGILASFAAPFGSQIVVSLMGSFYKGTIKYYFIRLLARISWNEVIVKSERMTQQVNIRKAHLIPNGVQVDKYKVNCERETIRKELGFESNKKYVIFVSDPQRPEKNFELCKQAVNLLHDENVKLVPVSNKTQKEVIKYQLAADVLMLCSFTEGSPNVIKEAMAAGCPIVTTDVGDVNYVIGNTDGCYILSSFDKEEATKYLRKALEFGKRTKGLERIIELGLDSMTISKKIVDLYN